VLNGDAHLSEIEGEQASRIRPVASVFKDWNALEYSTWEFTSAISAGTSSGEGTVPRSGLTLRGRGPRVKGTRAAP
jgi:hypothetical protein